MLLELRDIEKSFGNVKANAGVSLAVREGTIHAIVGENGAGKSTAMKILYGQLVPDGGDIHLNGKKCEWSSPKDAVRAGIGMVHQHFMLAGPHSVLDNILLGEADSRALIPYHRKEARLRLEELAGRHGFAVDPDALIENCPVGVQQRVEILKLLFRDSRILILDEPTAVLTPQETAELFQNLKGLRDKGATILIITHKLKEVMALADEVTVFRTGRVVAHREVASTNIEELAELMVGRHVDLKLDREHPGYGGEKAVRLETPEFSVRAGEIVGIAGVEGNGQTELVRKLLRLEPVKEGELYRLFGRELSSLSAAGLRSLGLGVLAEDRQRQSLLMESSIEENALLGYQRASEYLGGFSRFRSYVKARIRKAALKIIDEYDVRPGILSARAGSLSGGNQQKFVVGRELSRNPKFLIACQPTRGVDIGAIEFIHGKILKLREAGAGVLLISSELDEVMRLSDRLLVIYRGKIVAEFSRGSFDEQKIGLFMAGGKA